MESPLPEDPYDALGVAQDASSAHIKTVYRKLVLKYHPDKVHDETKKKAASDQFHKIQQAYEILGDEARRKHYDAMVRLVSLKKDVIEGKSERANASYPRDASHFDGSMPRPTTAAYDFKTSPTAKGATFGMKGPPRFEERKPSYVYEDHPRHEEVRIPDNRYDDDYYSRPKPKTTSRSGRYAEPEPVKVSRKENEKTSRSERSRASDRERTRERDFKYKHVEPVNVEYYEDSYRDPEKAGSRERDQFREEVRRHRTRADEDPNHDYDRQYKVRAQEVRSQEEQAREYQRRYKSSSAEPETRPSASRSNSARDTERVRRSATDARPSLARRSSAKKSDHSPPRRSRRDGDKKSPMPDIVEEPRRRDYNAHPNHSSDLEEMVSDIPQHFGRSYPAPTRSQETVPPVLRRSETAPIYPTASSRSKRDGSHPASSRLREANLDSGYNSPDSPVSDSFPHTTQYTQPKSSQSFFGATVVDEPIEYSNGRRTQRVEPTSHRKRSPSPREHRPRESSRRQHDAPHTPTFKTVQTYQYPSSTTVEPPSSAPSSVHPVEPVAERPRLSRRDAYHSSSRSSRAGLFGESGHGTTVAAEPSPLSSSGLKSSKKSGGEMMAGLAKSAPHQVQYAKQPKTEDIRLANPMGSRASGGHHRRPSATTSRGGFWRHAVY